MYRFKKTSYGYAIDEVEKYFTELEREHAAYVSRTREELAGVKEKNHQLKSDIKELMDDINRANSTRTQSVNYINEKLSLVEKSVETAQEETKTLKLAAVHRLQGKRDELLAWQNSLKRFKEDLVQLKQRYSSPDKAKQSST